VFCSTDHGETWTACGLAGLSVYALAVSPSGYILAGTLSEDGDNLVSTVFHSTDRGATWTKVNADFGNAPVLSFAVDAAERLFAASYGGGVFRLTDDGATWMAAALTRLDVRALVVGVSGDIFAGTDRGVFRSTDDGMTWTPINTGLMNQRDLSLAWTPSGHIFAGTESGGVFRTVEPTVE